MIRMRLSPRSFLITAWILASPFTRGQQPRFFKDAHAHQPTDGTPGKYVEVTTMQGDSIRRVEFKQVKKDLLLRSSFYRGDLPVGKWEEFDEKGKLVRVRDFGALKYDTCPLHDQPSVDSADASIQGAVFPGGMQELYTYMASQIIYPDEAYEAGIQGKVLIRGQVDANGDRTTLSICKGAHPFLDLEAWRVTDSFPDREPARKDGKAVACTYNLPVVFRLR